MIVEPPTFLKALFFPLKLVLPSVTVRKVIFLDDRSSDATLRVLTHVIGSLDRLPFEMNIVGARTKFDPEEYERTDPLGKPRPTSVKELEARLYPQGGHTRAVDKTDIDSSTAAPARSQRSWWQVWK